MPLFKCPDAEAAADNARVRIYVCQASFGDTFALEIDPAPESTRDEEKKLAVGYPRDFCPQFVNSRGWLEQIPSCHTH
jgi:hypothetical protein